MAKICSGDDFVTRFAKANEKNKKRFGEDARLAFKRHLDDLKRSKKNDDTFPYVFDEEKAKEIIEFANKLTIAEGAGDEIFTCDDWQELVLCLAGCIKILANEDLQTVMCRSQGSRVKVF